MSFDPSCRDCETIRIQTHVSAPCAAHRDDGAKVLPGPNLHRREEARPGERIDPDAQALVDRLVDEARKRGLDASMPIQCTQCGRVDALPLNTPAPTCGCGNSTWRLGRDRSLDAKPDAHLADADLADVLIARLNDLIQDPAIRGDVQRLIEARVSCSNETAEHPSIQVSEGQTFGVLGFLNGLVGTITNGPRVGWGYIAAEISDEGLLDRFVRTDGGAVSSNDSAPHCPTQVAPESAEAIRAIHDAATRRFDATSCGWCEVADPIVGDCPRHPRTGNEDRRNEATQACPVTGDRVALAPPHCPDCEREQRRSEATPPGTYVRDGVLCETSGGEPVNPFIPGVFAAHGNRIVYHSPEQVEARRSKATNQEFPDGSGLMGSDPAASAVRAGRAERPVEGGHGPELASPRDESSGASDEETPHSSFTVEGDRPGYPSSWRAVGPWRASYQAAKVDARGRPDAQIEAAQDATISDLQTKLHHADEKLRRVRSILDHGVPYPQSHLDCIRDALDDTGRYSPKHRRERAKP